MGHHLAGPGQGAARPGVRRSRPGAAFDFLKSFLESGARTPSYEAAADALGMGLGATKTLIHRLRKRYTMILRHEIARTVSDPGEVDAEIHALCEALIASKGQLDP